MRNCIIPAGVAVDATGNLFIADTDNNRIRKVGTNGIITTVAGKRDRRLLRRRGRGDQCGIDVIPLAWRWTPPATCSLRILVTTVIRKVGTNGIITTVAGNGDATVTPATGARRPMRNCIIPLAWRWTPPATCSLRIRKQPSSARWALTGLSPRWRATAGKRLLRRRGRGDQCGIGLSRWRGGGRHRQPVHCGYCITNASARWAPTESSPRWRAMGPTVISGDGGAATNAELYDPSAWRWTPPATCSLRILVTTASARWAPTGLSPRWRATGQAGTYSGDGGAATNAELNWSRRRGGGRHRQPVHCGFCNNRIRKVVFPGPTLVLNDVGFGNAGAYDVVVSSPYGSVTSSVVI